MMLMGGDEKAKDNKLTLEMLLTMLSQNNLPSHKAANLSQSRNE
jgi:hypothetical protein